MAETNTDLSPGVREENGLLNYKDSNGTRHILYPITKAELVDGLEDIQGHASNRYNPHEVTAEQVKLSDGETTVEAALNGKQEALTGSPGQVVGFDEDGLPVAQAAPSGGGGFTVQATAPEDTGVLWIDTTANTGGLKYYNGTAWAPVPVAYS